MLSSILTRDVVVKKLIRIRCRYANKYADILQLQDFVDFQNEHSLSQNTNEEQKFIYSLFPPRKQWCHIGASKRLSLDSTKRNELKLWNTYKKAEASGEKKNWYISLCDYADFIIRLILQSGYRLETPRVLVLEKELTKDSIICRPVCTFPLRIKLALSLINKCLTKLLDEQFYPCSYAFRVPGKWRNEFQHLDAINELKHYRERHENKRLYVAECDMQKFYDTIDHNIIKKRFSILISHCKRSKNIETKEIKILKRWFYAYVDCFDFRRDVYKINAYPPSHTIWKKIRNPENKKCEIQWVNELIKRKNKEPIGVPQGGALSGVIANIVMHFVDVDVCSAIANRDACYIRFCDDMILVGTDYGIVEGIFKRYQQSIKDSLLFCHKSKSTLPKKMKDFWRGKTKGPYAWDSPQTNVYPWVTFVGFDCNWRGELRVRKKSIKKQVKKQYSTAFDLINQYTRGARAKYGYPTILASLQNRLVGMSVGRIGLYNYSNNPNTHSWMSAFSVLDKNPWSEKQMKILDSHRYIVLSRAKKVLWSLGQSPDRTKDSECKQHKGRNYVGKAFSYYGQCFDYK